MHSILLYKPGKLGVRSAAGVSSVRRRRASADLACAAQALIDGAPGGYQPLSSSIGNLTGNLVRVLSDKQHPCHLRPHPQTPSSKLTSNRIRSTHVHECAQDTGHVCFMSGCVRTRVEALHALDFPWHQAEWELASGILAGCKASDAYNISCAGAAARGVHRVPLRRRLRGAVRHLGGGHLPLGERQDDHLRCT